MDDLECMACPPKYRHIATFWKYYSGAVKPPYPTLFSEPAGPVRIWACCSGACLLVGWEAAGGLASWFGALHL